MPRKRPGQEYGHAVKRPTIDEILASPERFSRATSDLLRIDVERLRSKLARQTYEATKRQRNIEHARTGYDMIVEMIERVKLTHRIRKSSLTACCEDRAAARAASSRQQFLALLGMTRL